MDKNFIGERISELRLKKNVSEYQMSLDLGKNKSCLDLAATEIYLRFRARRFSMEMSASISSSSSCFIRSVALSIRGRLCSSESKNC